MDKPKLEDLVSESDSEDVFWEPAEYVNTVQSCNAEDCEEWLVESGTNVNVTGSDENMKDVTRYDQHIMVRNGRKAPMVKQGEIILREKGEEHRNANPKRRIGVCRIS